MPLADLGFLTFLEHQEYPSALVVLEFPFLQWYLSVQEVQEYLDLLESQALL